MMNLKIRGKKYDRIEESCPKDHVLFDIKGEKYDKTDESLEEIDDKIEILTMKIQEIKD